MEQTYRKTLCENLNVFSPLFSDKDNIEITEWSNGEGWDVVIHTTDSGDRSFSLHIDELEAIIFLTKYLSYKCR